MKTIILYYSRTGNTAAAAKAIADEISVDIIEIKDLVNRSGPLGYMKGGIDAFRGNKTSIEPSGVDLQDYDLIYIGTPVWSGKPSPAIITLIDNSDFRGKDVILFATMRSSGGRKTIERMREKIELRGGRMITSFAIKTANKSSEQIMLNVKKLIEEMDLKIYGI